MIMAEKKDRGRYTLRLNEKDPAHAEVIRVLEQQGHTAMADLLSMRFCIIFIAEKHRTLQFVRLLTEPLLKRLYWKSYNRIQNQIRIC